MKNKILIIPLMLICLALSVFAYDVNDTLRINGEYKELGVFTNVTDANITIYYPNGLTAVDNVQMNYSSVGNWYYDYDLIEPIGVYDILIVFTDSGTYKGNETDTFIVGDLDTLNWGFCPTGDGRTMLYVVLGMLFIISIIGLLTKNVGLTFIGGFILLLSFLVTARCGDLLWIVTTFFGLALLMASASMKT